MNKELDEIIEALMDAESVLGEQRLYKGDFTRNGYSVKEKVASAILMAKQLQTSIQSVVAEVVADQTPEPTPQPEE